MAQAAFRYAHTYLHARLSFSTEYGTRYVKTVETLAKDQDQMLTFFDFPAVHWPHLRTINQIESTFATVKA